MNVRDLIDTGSNAMPPFADALSNEEKGNVIAYLTTLQR
jgi:mono/diheme cytochrome c family protein